VNRGIEPPRPPPLPAPYQVREVSVRAGAREVRVAISMPGVLPPSVVPALVIAPGRRYHRDRPLTRGLFERAAAEGFAVARFDWSFYAAGRDPSPAFADEVEELGAVIEHVRDLEGVDRSHFYIAGKSLGAGVALERAASDPSIRGVVLMTPPIHTPKPEFKMGTVRPRFEHLRQPALVIVGERDPLCDLSRLYGLLAGLPHPPELAVVGGDHSLRAETEPEAVANLDLALKHAVDWLRRQSVR